MKKVISLALVCVMLLALLSGCGAKKEEAPAAQAPAAEEAAKPDKVYKMRVGSAAAFSQPLAAVLNDFEAAVEERTNGGIDVELYLAGQVGGSDDELNRKVMTGTLEMSTSALSYFTAQCPVADIFYMPFLYADHDLVRTVCTAPESLALIEDIETTGLRCLAITTSGGTTIASKEELKSVADMQGNFKMRSPATEAYSSVYEAIGINIYPIGFGEAFTCVQQDTVDGLESSFVTLSTNNFQEAGIKYAWNTNQIIGFMGYFVSIKWLESLPAEYQTIVVEEIQKASNQSTEDTLAMEQEIMDAGDPFIVHQPTEEEMAELKSLTAPLYDKKVPVFVEDVGEDTVKAWFELMGAEYTW
ncbi:MAG: TRAP transporter substrate-binding protein [Ruminococcaceae bacterium]|nr:TRAP transporter substrate-binding protein [Oscillospiraceae bacterium]